MISLFLMAALASADEPFRVEVRDTQVCATGIEAQEICYQKIDLPRGGLDVRGQLAGFDALKDGQIPITKVPTVAAGIAVSDDHRRQTLEQYPGLRITLLALAPVRPTTNDKGERMSEWPFMSRVTYQKVGQPGEGETFVVGHLVLPEDGKGEVPSDNAQLNALWSKSVHVTRLSEGGISEAQVREVLAPAVLANFAVALVAEELERLIELFKGEDPKAVQSPGESPAQI